MCSGSTRGGCTRRAGWATATKNQAAAALRLVQRAPGHGLTVASYDDADLPRLLASKQSIEETLGADVAQIARLDVRITTSLLTLGRDVAVGRTSPASIDRRWKAARTPPDLVATLVSAADAKGLDGWLDTVRPVHPEYAALQAALAALHAQLGDGADAPATNACAAWRSTSNAGAGCPTISGRATSWSTSRRFRWRCARTAGRRSR